MTGTEQGLFVRQILEVDSLKKLTIQGIKVKIIMTAYWLYKRIRRFLMNLFTKKTLALLLVIVFAVSAVVSATVPALAYDAASPDIIDFYASVESYTHKLNWLNLDMDNRFIAIDEAAFAFELEDSNGRVVADETMGHLEFFTPAENDGLGFEAYFYFNDSSKPKLDDAESYTMTLPAGIFLTSGTEQSTTLVVNFTAAEFISERTGFFGFLDYIYNTPVLRVLFAPFIALIEFIYYISSYFAMG